MAENVNWESQPKCLIFLPDNQAVKMEKDEDFNHHHSHTGLANSKLGGDKICQDFCQSQTNLFNRVRTGPKPHKKVIVT